MTDEQLFEHARNAINFRQLTPNASAGGVASALITDKGNVFVGVCIDTSCSMGFCAEHNALGNMITNGESKIATIIAVNADGEIMAPCGRCREFIYLVDEGNRHARVLLRDGRVATIQELLPEHWVT